MKKLDLSKCKNNEDVCRLVSERVKEVAFTDLLKEVEKKFVYQSKAVRAIYTGLSMNMNVFLSGPGGYGKTTLIKFILDFYKIPYHTITGYKDMPVDALLGVPDMDKLLNKSVYEIKFKESIFYKPGVLIGEEFTDILPSTAAALKDILTERGFRDKNGKTESLICSMIIAANKSSRELVDDESKKAFYEGRFPIRVEVLWKTHEVEDYFNFLKIKFPDTEEKLLYFISNIFYINHNEYNNTVSPRLAETITKVYINNGVNYLDNFNIDISKIEDIKNKAEESFNKKTVKKTFKDLFSLLLNNNRNKEYKNLLLFSFFRINNLKVNPESVADFSKATEDINLLIKQTNYLKTKEYNEINEIFKNIENDKTSSKNN